MKSKECHVGERGCVLVHISGKGDLEYIYTSVRPGHAPLLIHGHGDKTLGIEIASSILMVSVGGVSVFSLRGRAR